MELIVKLARGEVDPVTGVAVSAHPHPTPSHSGVRRTFTQPTPCRGRPSSSAPVKSSSMPNITPRGTSNQKPQECRRRDVGGRRKETPRKQGAGLLQSMFERARSKVADQENSPPADRSRDLQDVSDIVLACKPGHMPARAAGAHGGASPEAMMTVGLPNPFANIKSPTTSTVMSPSNFVSPFVTNLGGGSPPDSRHVTVSRNNGGTDAWSRLREGYLATTCPGVGGTGEHAEAAVETDSKDTFVEVVEVPRQIDSPLSVVPAVATALGNKRTLSAVASAGGRAKKPKQGMGRKHPPRAPGNEKTMLSFFGRAELHKA